IHWTSWKEALNACANVGKPALAMLVSSDGSSMESARLASAQCTEGVRSALPATTASRCALIGFKRTSVFWQRSNVSYPNYTRLFDRAEDAPFALYSCVWRHVTNKRCYNH